MSDPQLVQLAVVEQAPAIPVPPTQDELPYDDGIPMESPRHKRQMELLIDPLGEYLKDRDAFVGGNMFVYFSMAQVHNQDFRGPDVFVVLDVPRGERKSWVVWEEGKGPDVVIELLSDSTAQQDKIDKKQIYQSQLRVPEYFWFDPFNSEDWQGFALEKGVYQPIPRDESGRLVSQQLGLTLAQWSGEYKEINTVWLRWATLDGVLLPTERELVEQERQRAEQAELLLEQERQRGEQLAERLRAMGVDLSE